MKFNWGTGILLVLVLFLAGGAVFIIFASRQTVNLVHKDYYEKGVDYSEEMKVQARSKPFANSIETTVSADGLKVVIDSIIASRIDSGELYLYRPSDKNRDITIKLNGGTTSVNFPRDQLINGRYILKFTWFDDNIKYQISRPVNVQ
jgi:hypothetical protein